MGEIGHGYGSEWHLLRHLGYHREYLSCKVLKAIGGNSVEWLDFVFSNENKPLKDDRELAGLEFIKDIKIQEQWKSFWPQTGNAHNWDVVGKIHFDDHDEWLLVEAKAHCGEIKNKCGAISPKSIQIIKSAIEKTRQACGNQSQPTKNWLEPYYQYANRLAVLYFLMNECSPPVYARLLFIYFYGENIKNRECPQSEQEWLPEIQEMNARLRIDKSSKLFHRAHALFLPINPTGKGVRLEAESG